MEDGWCTLSNGVRMPSIGLGTYRLRDDAARTSVHHAVVECGYRLIDTAAVYRNEEAIGETLRQTKTVEPIFLTSKLMPKDHGRQRAYDACLESMRKLGVDCLDLYLIHWPGKQGIPSQDPRNAQLRRQSWEALEQLYEEGRCRAIGVSNYTARHLEELLSYARIPPHVLQVECHVLLPQRELLAFCKAHNICMQAYSSFGEGRLLNGDVSVPEEWKQLGERSGLPVGALLLRWALAQGMAVIPKSSNPERIRENRELALCPCQALAETDWLALGEVWLKHEGGATTRFCWDPSMVQ